jgi:succinate dehydrogenase / fumarate reductase, cytochrome b subunit
MAAAPARPFFLSTIGKKYLMAATGLVWAGFVLSHMAGNMLILISPSLYNAYGHAIVSNKPLLFVAETGLILSIIVHVTTAIMLTIENRRARPQRYAISPNGEKGASLASKTMAIQGSLILAFIVLHITTFKYGTIYQTTVDGVVMRDLHRLVVEVFHQPGYVAWYGLCLLLLGFHLSHGVGSIFQSLGLRSDRAAKNIKKMSLAYGAIVATGFLSQPIYVFFFNP